MAEGPRRSPCLGAGDLGVPQLVVPDVLATPDLETWRRAGAGATDCPEQKPPVWAVKRPVSPYESPAQSGFAQENAKGA
jgi:hypothetical protein